MPVHGEAVHLRAHAMLAREVGIPKKNIFVIDNGETLVMRDGKVRRGEPVESGIVYVDGSQVGETEPAVLRDRKRLAEDGVVTCVVMLSKSSGKVTEVRIESRGVTFADEEMVEGARSTVRNAVDGARGGSGSDLEATRRTARNALSNYLWNQTHTRPMVIPVMLEV